MNCVTKDTFGAIDQQLSQFFDWLIFLFNFKLFNIKNNDFNHFSVEVKTALVDSVNV